MTDFFVSIGEKHCTRLELFVPWGGAWFVDAVLDDTTDDLSGAVVVRLGSLELHGTVLPSYTGSFALARSLRIVGGAGGWGNPCEPQDYADDAGVSAEAVALDAAQIAGETLGSFDPAEPTLETHFVRRIATASSVLEQALGDGRIWWVDTQGVTQAGQRTTFEPTAGSYNLLNYSPLTRIAELAVDDPASLWVGAILKDRLTEPQTVREMRLTVEVDKETGSGKCRVFAWTGGDELSQSRLGRAVAALLAQRESKRLYGTYRYRVVSVDSDKRLQLQAVRPISGLPDVLPVSQVAGIASAVSTPDEGTIVRVAFDEGDCTMPYVSGWPAGDPDKVSGIARMSDLITSGGPGTVITLSLGPMAGAYTAPALALGSPTGTVPVVMAGVPYLCSFSDVVTIVDDPTPPTILPPKADPLLGYILSASDKGAIE